MPWRPVSRYPSSHPWQRCSLSTSMTRPSGPSSSSIETISAIEQRFVASKIEFRRLESDSSGQNMRKFVRIHSEDVAEEISEFARRLGENLPRAGNLKRIVREVGQREGDQLASAIDMGIAAHAPVASRRESREFFDELARSRRIVPRPCSSSSRLQES